MRLHISLEQPAINCCQVEAPFARDAEARQFTDAQKLVYGRRMNAKICCKLPYRHYTAQTVLTFSQFTLFHNVFKDAFGPRTELSLMSRVFFDAFSVFGGPDPHLLYGTGLRGLGIEFHQKEQILRCLLAFRQRYRNSRRGGPLLRYFCVANASPTKIKETAAFD